jgi:parallel beta-helix repeat protein
LVQGNNFGVGIEGNGTNNNVVEENTILGNSNGLYLTATVQGNIIRGNVITGNPSVQVSTDNPSGSGLDIKNLAPPGANAFLGNVCQTAMNATCGLVGPSLDASPNPIPVTGNVAVGVTTLTWNAPGAQVIEIHVGAPDGPLFTRMGSRGSAQTGAWVGDGTIFYLQDVSGGNPLTADYTLATAVVHLQHSGAARLRFHGRPGAWASGLWALLLVLAACFVRPRAVAAGAFLLAAVALAQSPEPQTTATLDRMVAAHKSQQDLAQYVFDTQGCKGCHTVGQNGKLGFSARGTETAKGFEGCIAMLTAVSHIASVPVDQRTPQQQKKTSRFAEFGCTLCHKVAAGKVAMTGMGAKLANLHLGCVDIERTLADRR